jgi:DNA modification methylase
MEIKPYYKNAKKHPLKQIEQIAASIKEFGFNQPIVVDKNGVIIVGHGRYEAAQLLGMDSQDIPVVTVDLTEEQANAYRLADNKLNESDWDMKLVVEELKSLSLPMLDLTGFDRDLILSPEEKDDEVPAIPETPRSKVGDIYELGQHRVLCGDSTQQEAVVMLMDGKKADMVFTDPPYNISFGGSMSNTTKDGKMIKHKGANQRHDEIKNDSMNEIEFSGFIKTMLTTIKMYCDGAYYISFGSQTLNQLLQPMKELDIEYKSIIIWMKNQATLSGKDYKGRYEPIIYGRFNDNFFGVRFKQEDIWEVQRTLKNDLHPTMKPIPLIEKALINSSERGMKILDLFLGSGSTLIAAEKTGRKCYGMELDPKYVDVIVQRYVDYVQNPVVKLNGNIIIWNKTKPNTQVVDPQ